MKTQVTIKVSEESNPEELANQISEIGFKLLRISRITDDFVLLIGSMDHDNVVKLQNYEGVSSFQADRKIKKPKVF